MYLSYVLAWFGKTDIAEELSKTIVTAVIGVVIPYLITKTIANVSKYGWMPDKNKGDDEIDSNR